MKRKHKIQIFLVIAVSLLLPLLSAYIDYYALKEADFLSANLKFENTDSEVLSFCKKQKFICFSDSSDAFGIINNLIEHFSHVDYQATDPQLKTLVLRC